MCWGYSGKEMHYLGSGWAAGRRRRKVSQVLRVLGFLREGMLRSPKSSSSTPTPATFLSESEQESKLSW